MDTSSTPSTARRSPVKEAVDTRLKGGLAELLASDLPAESVTFDIFTRTKLRVSASTIRRWRAEGAG